jgi:hypothetical protein
MNKGPRPRFTQFFAIAVLGVGSFAGLRCAASAEPVPLPAPTASPSASPAPASDPCESMSALVSRPSVATSPCSVKPNHLLIESGYSNTAVGGAGGSNTALYPQASLRAGVLGKLEFDLDPSSIVRQSSPILGGTSDSGIGFHYEFGYTDKIVYGTNVVYTIANGTPAFSANGDGVLLNLDGAYTLSSALGLFGTLGYETQSAGTVSVPARYRAFAPALGLTWSLPAGFDAFVEGFGQTANGPGQSGRYAYDFAVQKDVGSRLQLDVDLAEHAPASGGAHQTATGFGVSYLIGAP